MGQTAGAVTLDPEGLRPWLTLANAPGAGLRGINRLLAHFGLSLIHI